MIRVSIDVQGKRFQPFVFVSVFGFVFVIVLAALSINCSISCFYTVFFYISRYDSLEKMLPPSDFLGSSASDKNLASM